MEAPPRIAPIVYYSLWLALARHDLSLCRKLEQEYHTTLATLEQTKDIGALSAIPVKELVERLMESEAFTEVAFFAGEIAFSELGAIKRRPLRVSLKDTVEAALGALRALLPDARIELMPVTSGRVFKCANSPFVQSNSAMPTCGFISGFASGALVYGGHPRQRVKETVCISVNPEADYCMFEL
jgi:hypothetical protein